MFLNMSNFELNCFRSNLKVKEALKLIEENEFEKLLDKENLKVKAVSYAEQYGIIFVVREMEVSFLYSIL